MTPRALAAGSRETGFVLIGVVIFVLALTIIGLSLYSLSSYEAVFLQRSTDREQAFQTALSGIEHAKFALGIAPYNLGRVTQGLPDGVDSLVAIQVQNADSVSTGPLDVSASAASVLIRATAHAGEAYRTVEGSFMPHQAEDYYDRLITASDSIAVIPFAAAAGPPTDRRQTVHLVGDLWAGGQPPDLSWVGNLAWPRPDTIVTTPGVELPAVADYLQAHPPTSMAAAPVPAADPLTGALTLTLAGSTTPPTFLREPPGYQNSGFSFYIPSYQTQLHKIRVSGRVIWVLPYGARFEDHLVIENPGHSLDACLVIVAGPATPSTWDRSTGLRFFGGLRSEIPLILVSSATVYIEHLNNPVPSIATLTYVPDVSVYARKVELTGPQVSSLPWVGMWLVHSPTGELATNHLPYLSAGYLPNASSGTGLEFKLLAGTWRTYPQ